MTLESDTGEPTILPAFAWRPSAAEKPHPCPQQENHRCQHSTVKATYSS